MKRLISFALYIFFILPFSLVSAQTAKGFITPFNYEVSTVKGHFTKTAQVYIPACYDANDKDTLYPVLFLAHGGGDNAMDFFSGNRGQRPLGDIADELIDNGKMKPMFIVCITYYKGDDDPDKSMGNTIDDCLYFHRELRNDLIPALEKNYNLYKTRDQRAYGGFSMGSLSTWYQLAYGLNEIKYFIPLSGDLWVYDRQQVKQPADVAARWLNEQVEKTPYRGHDFEVWGYTGSRDIACKPENALVGALMLQAPLFEYGVNLHYEVFEGGDHQYKYINQYLTNALTHLFQ